MRSACPSCAAVYEVPDALLGRGRKVRCARCGEAWMLRPASPPSEPEAAAPPESPALAAPPPAPMPEPASRPARVIATPPRQAAPAGGLLLVAAWVGSLLLLAGGVAAAWIFRQEVMAAWPPAARLFAALGG
ncbi:zinc-ribbon domain-containing protein [Siccirubricoccus sp. KC 17139]|uniref:Zinc-ribbon domain-containing protein n=1 Tax=Siccirubricoccus soli TaxID=2899147 RepID=A0ABT1DBB6_9PROT|nr:zinc-ribbon domain-containing protein [Siccirubricoccus soli]MCO6418260.1 zinc-ribbon domain-containing protein [Siccirubricoccus soli]MCP2684395.1 zinc-ribbon domain-containing protein [Siccirubricoccus soli]